MMFRNVRVLGMCSLEQKRQKQKELFEFSVIRIRFICAMEWGAVFQGHPGLVRTPRYSGVILLCMYVLVVAKGFQVWDTLYLGTRQKQKHTSIFTYYIYLDIFLFFPVARKNTLLYGQGLESREKKNNIIFYSYFCRILLFQSSAT